jgi:hypothetical protein
MKPVAHYMEAAGIGERELISRSGLDRRLVRAIIAGNYTPSPEHRQRLAAALGVPVADIAWDHAVEVQHLRGNGPQCGRST